eukprot:18054-Amphidinium_carterae.3
MASTVGEMTFPVHGFVADKGLAAASSFSFLDEGADQEGRRCVCVCVLGVGWNGPGPPSNGPSEQTHHCYRRPSKPSHQTYMGTALLQNTQSYARWPCQQSFVQRCRFIAESSGRKRAEPFGCSICGLAGGLQEWHTCEDKVGCAWRVRGDTLCTIWTRGVELWTAVSAPWRQRPRMMRSERASLAACPFVQQFCNSQQPSHHLAPVPLTVPAPTAATLAKAAAAKSKAAGAAGPTHAKLESTIPCASHGGRLRHCKQTVDYGAACCRFCSTSDWWRCNHPATQRSDALKFAA